MTTALIYDPIFLEHHTPLGHPERPQRLEVAMKVLEVLNWLERDGLVILPSRAAVVDELASVHEREYIQQVVSLCQMAFQYPETNRGHCEDLAAPSVTDGIEYFTQEEQERSSILALGMDTYVSEKSYEVACQAAGAGLVAVDAVLKGEVDNAYCLVRPPGHHALAGAATGFCIFNNVAIAARYALDRHGLERVMIVDYDVHHGNGTQKMFYNDPRVLYFSIHQAPFYPGTGFSDERGEGAALGTTINVPLPAGAGFEIYEPIFRYVLAPAADRFRPQLILVSAGFDAHWRETVIETGLLRPGMLFSTAGFAKLNRLLMEIANAQCAGRLILIQEGGYDIGAFSSCVATCINLLLGGDEVIDSEGPAPKPSYRLNMDALIAELCRIHQLTGYRMQNVPKPGLARLRHEVKEPEATTNMQEKPVVISQASENGCDCQQDR